MSAKGSQGRSSSANPANLDEIKESLSRIENVLNQGQHVLYGDDADGGEPADAGAVAVRAEDDHHTYHSYHSTPNKHAAANAASPEYQRSPAVHPPVPPRHAEAAAAPSPYHQAYYGHGAPRDSDHARHSLHDSQPRGNSGSAARARTTPAHLSAARRGSRAKKEEEELSASARALKIQEMKRSSGRVPNFEEGVDDDDTAQNTSIEELKERIRRELEEYQRNGPLMHRRASYQRKQRAATVPRASGAPKAAPPSAPAAGASRSLPPPRPAAPKAKTTKRVAGSTQHQQATPVRGAASRSAVPPPPPTRAATKKTSVSGPAAKPRAKTAAPPASRAAAPAADTRHSTKPFWERLYGDAAVQQEKRDQRAEQRRIELEAERAKAMPRRRSHRPPAHAAYSAYYRNLNGDSATQSRDLSANRARAGANVPAQHASYVPKRTVAAPASAAAPAASSGAASGHSASGAPARVAPRRPVPQPAAKKPLGAAPRPVPLPLGPGPRTAPEAEAEHKEEELLVPTPPPPAQPQPQPASSSVKDSRGRSNEPFGDELDDAPAQNGTRGAAEEEAHVRHSDSDSDADSEEENAKSTSHPFVSRLDLSGIKK